MVDELKNYELEDDSIDGAAGGAGERVYNTIIFHCVRAGCDGYCYWENAAEPSPENYPTCGKCGSKTRIEIMV